MTGRERILAALSHRQPDRVPIDLGGTPATGIAAETAARLREAIRLSGPVRVDPGPQLAILDAEMCDRLSVDVIRIGPPADDKWEQFDFGSYSGEVPGRQVPRRRRDGALEMKSTEGLELEMPQHATSFHAVRRPLAAAENEAHIQQYYKSLSPQATESECDAIAQAAENAPQQLARVGAFPIATFEACHLRGLEVFLLDLLAEPAMAEALMRRHAEYMLEYWRPVLERVGRLLDVIFVGDDLASQSGLLVSREVYRRHVMPIQREVWGELRRLAPQAKLLYHSCGAILPLIPDLIELGIDALNPLQTNAAGMDPALIKSRFGSDVALWGGGVEPHESLVKGTPDKTRDEVRRRMEVLARNGGYIFAPTQEIPAGIRMENFEAMLGAVLEFRP